MKLIVGLGNPGKKYAKHRHNVGFMVVDELAQAGTFSVFKEKYQAQLSKGIVAEADVVLMLPQTYMNNSGQAVQAVASFYKIKPADILVIHDDLDLPFGTVRQKLGGGHAGHNGLKSIDAHLGTRDYARLRVGIGHPGDKEQVNAHVLSDFSVKEAALLAEQLPNLVQAITMWIKGEEKES